MRSIASGKPRIYVRANIAAIGMQGWVKILPVQSK
jgi:hypothetical protein